MGLTLSMSLTTSNVTAKSSEKSNIGEVSMEKPFIVIVVLEAKPGKEEELKQALMEVIKPHRSEKACLEYRLHQDVNNAAQFVIYARWVNEEEHEKEFNKPYVSALMKKLDVLLVRPLQAIVVEDIEP